jgi:hypothetical protein
MDHWEYYKENLSLAFEKPIGNGNTYSRAGTAELKPYLRTSKKFRKKLDFPVAAEKMALVIGKQRSIFKGTVAWDGFLA